MAREPTEAANPEPFPDGCCRAAGVCAWVRVRVCDGAPASSASGYLSRGRMEQVMRVPLLSGEVVSKPPRYSAFSVASEHPLRKTGGRGDDSAQRGSDNGTSQKYEVTKSDNKTKCRV